MLYSHTELRSLLEEGGPGYFLYLHFCNYNLLPFTALVSLFRSNPTEHAAPHSSTISESRRGGRRRRREVSREYCDPSPATIRTGERLTMTGSCTSTSPRGSPWARPSTGSSSTCTTSSRVAEVAGKEQETEKKKNVRLVKTASSLFDLSRRCALYNFIFS